MSSDRSRWQTHVIGGCLAKCKREGQMKMMDVHESQPQCRKGRSVCLLLHIGTAQLRQNH